MQSLPPSDPGLDERLQLIVESYRRLTGKALIENAPTDIIALRIAIWNAPRAIVAHNTEADPIFFYGNHMALQLFDMSFDDFTRMPSRLSAEPLAQETREKLLEKVTRQGYVEGYSGVRIARNTRRFKISDTTVWNLVDVNGLHKGQAATFVAPK